MNIISAFVGFLVFLAIGYGVISMGIAIPCGFILPAIIGGVAVGIIAK